ncbi:MAG: hypothetical protein Unbinned2691contig1000_41 [Prokaryotic dsDNA virus sp.]|nr:MAG: hypothetical protein Unbinned2691contig1000_41 [Prokaryotic dsDNA virus sp.]|tara:strand:- start:3828 stop:4670 length:843 start_codon:yes stop_codon:yes gene_type:complete
MPLNAFPNMKFGADPELFVVDANGEGVCPTFLEGTKENPEPVNGGALQRDGMAAEFNIDPATSYKQWEGNFQKVLTELERRLPAGHSLLAAPSLTFSEKVWDSVPEDAKELGCSPDFNAWTGELNPPPDGERIPRMRTAAGHIHIGWTEDADTGDADYVAACTDLVKQLDWYLGAPALQFDKDKTRRELYGKAGAMRFKPYGTEYRVLSNWWVMSPSYRAWAWNRVQQALNQMAKSFLPESSTEGLMASYAFNDRVVKSINTGKMDSKLRDHFHFPMREI